MDEILKTINLVSQRDWKAGSLAHGQKQWLEIGMLLAQNAKLLLVDEPAAGMTDDGDAQDRRAAPLASPASTPSSSSSTTWSSSARSPPGGKSPCSTKAGALRRQVDEVQNDERVLDVYLGRKKRHSQGCKTSQDPQCLHILSSLSSSCYRPIARTLHRRQPHPARRRISKSPTTNASASWAATASARPPPCAASPA